MWYLKLILVIVFAFVLYQDFKSRLVYWFLYPIIGVLAFAIQLQNLPVSIALTNLGFNLLFVVLILLVSTLYIKFRNLDFKNTIGIGDILFFLFIAGTFSIVSFLVLFVFSLVFSLILHIVLNNKKEQATVPLAGYMSLFFGVVYAVSFCFNNAFLYAY
ncbi:general secretion pathway protein [Flavobacterium sp. KACC 22758]|uniref:general secretion pathway protein n=1 Tax=Flavobacterium sp. KACC 22758 TaxID=3025667 RepID=UPI002366A461|nr:general secretion pathway protein [Flavobacterium sp. KACC 22758]WDF60815.1 general secretion pathway protein [Flavobacterium sp. KACC 22758]